MNVDPLNLLERLVTVENSLKAAHQRVDKHESSNKEALTEIKEDVSEIKSDVKDLVGFMNRGRGWAAAALLGSGLIGALASKIMTVFLK